MVNEVWSGGGELSHGGDRLLTKIGFLDLIITQARLPDATQMVRIWQEDD